VTAPRVRHRDRESARRRTVEQAGVALPAAVNGTITLPRAVDPKKLVGPDWATFRAETTNIQARADYSLSDNWALTVEAGRSKVDRDRTLPIFQFTNAAAVATGTCSGTITPFPAAVPSSLTASALAPDWAASVMVTSPRWWCCPPATRR